MLCRTFIARNKSNLKMYPTTLNTKYSFSIGKKSVQIKDSNGVEAAVYLDSKMNAYDKGFNLIRAPERTKAVQRQEIIFNNITHSKIPAYFSGKTDNDMTFPDPLDFEVYEEFHKALLAWKAKALSYVSSVKLPHPIVAKFFYPSPPKIINKECRSMSVYKNFSPKAWPLLPDNYVDFLKIILHDNERPPLDKDFPNQIPKREVIKYQHHVTYDNQWETQVIVPEPLPSFYNKFEEFESAYQKWQSITINEIKTPPIPPAEFAKIAKIDMLTYKYDIFVPPTAPEKKIPKQVPKKFTKEDIIFKKDPIEFMEIPPPDTNYYMTNIDSKEFLDDFLNYGVHTPTLTVTHQLSPTFCFEFTCDCDSTKLDEILSQPLTNQKLKDLMNLRFSDKIILACLRKYVNGKVIANLIADYLKNPDAFKYLLSLSQQSNQHDLRVTFFIKNLIYANSDFSLLTTLYKEVHLLHEVVKKVVRVQQRCSIVPILSDDYKIFNLLYLATLLLEMQENESCAYVFMQENIYNFNQECIKYLKNREINTKEFAKMIFFAPLQTIHQIVLGSKAFLWLSQQKYITELIHSELYFTLLHIFQHQILNVPESIRLFSPQHSLFFKYFLTYLIKNGQNSRLILNSDVLMLLIQNIKDSDEPFLWDCMIPLAELIKIRSLASSTSEYVFNKLIFMTTENLCSKTTNNTDLLERVLKCLLIFVDNSETCKAITGKQPFAIQLIENLTSLDRKITILSWQLLQKISMYPAPKIQEDPFHIILQLEKPGSNKSHSLFQEAVLDILKTNQNNQLQSFLDFSHFIITQGVEVEKILYLKKFEPAFGPLSCLYKNRFTQFKRSYRIQVLLQQIFNDFECFRGNETLEPYLNKFMIHFDDSKKK